MKKIITIAIIILVSTAIQMITILPWWSFLIPVFISGVLLPLKKWKVSSFPLGFAAGFLVWLISTLYFEITYKEKVTNSVSEMIGIPQFLLYILIGLIGGILTGLAFYSGFLLRRGREILHLELPEN